MNYILALDLGTSSIGYTVFEIDHDDQPSHVLDVGVRIFSDGRDPKTKEPLAVSRRTARGIRRNRDRSQNRVRRLVKELIEFGLLPEDEKTRAQIFSELCPYECRAKAIDEELDKQELARAIFHIGRRRGFKSNRLDDSKEETEFKEKISALREKLNEQTLGQYLHQKNQHNRRLQAQGKPKQQKSVRFKKGETEFYADRQMYLDEFTRIRECQGNTHLSDEQWDALQETAFWQYPLRPVPKGKCRFYPEESRAHISLPISHEFRIYQEVNSLRYRSQDEEHELNQRQREAVYHKLNSSKSASFTTLLKLKDENKSPYFPSDAEFNLDVASRSGKLKGNEVMCDLRKPEYLGDYADRLDSQQLNDIIHHLIEPIKQINGKDVVIEGEELEQWLQQQLPSLSSEQINNLCRFKFKRDTASVSRKFMAQVVPVLKDTGLVYSDAVALCKDAQGRPLNHSDFTTGEVLQRLPYYGKVMPESVWGAQPEADKSKADNERDNDAFHYGKIANPTVHVALNQLRFVVNQIIDRQGCAPAKIHIELTRDLKNSKDARAKIASSQAKNKKNNDRIRERLKYDHSIEHARREDLQKYKLWEELGKEGARLSVFSGRPISAHQLFNGEVEIEHIIPFSRCYDDGMSNKTLAFKDENNQKAHRTPHEAFATETGGAFCYSDIMKRALAAFGQSSKYDRFKEGAYESFYGGERGDMIERQLNDTKYISRKARQYLSCLCTTHNVVSVNGQMTAVLRDVWQLNHFKDKAAGHYRDDHRHHIVDAFVVGLTSRALVQALSTQRSQQVQSKDDMYHFLKARAPDIGHLKQELFLALDNTIASYKPDHTQQGSLYNDTAYGIGQDEDGRQVCITRKAVSALSFTEVFDIRDEGQKQNLLEFLTNGAGADNKKQLQACFTNAKAFEQKKILYSQKTGIKKLRINVLNDSVKPIPSAPFKGYALNSYAYCDIWQVPTKKDKQTGQWQYKYQGVFVPYAEVKQYQQTPKRPTGKDGRSHPAAKKLMRLYKDDNIRLQNHETGSLITYKISGYSTGRNKLFLNKNLSAQSNLEEKSINTVFLENQVKKLRA